MSRVHLVEIRTTGFRNLASALVSWSPTGNLVSGANGQGKTNLLEAVTVFGNLRSFRVSSMRQVVAHGGSEFYLEGKVETKTGTLRLSQHVIPGPPVRRVLEVGGVATGVAQYLRVFPVVALSGADRELIAGGPHTRRTFLDRFSFFSKIVISMKSIILKER